VWINAIPFRVGGVLPESFAFPHKGESPDIYIPLNRSDFWGARGMGGLGVIARLKPAVRMERFQAELDSRSTALASGFPATNRDIRFAATDAASFLLGNRLRLLHWLMAAVLVLLTVSLANAGGIWLAQWLRQQRHVSIQLALGASLGRVWAEQAAQVLVLGAVASIAGLLGAGFLLGVLRASTLFGAELEQFELWRKAGLDPRAALLLTGLALAASLLSGLLPLVTIRGSAMRQTLTGRSSRRLRVSLAVAQLLLTGTLAYAGLLIGRNVRSLLEADRGFRTEQILVSGIGIPEAKYNTDEKMIRFHQQAIEELKRMPGVIDAAGGNSLPVSRATTRFLLNGETAPRDEQRIAAIGVASAGSLSLLGIPLRHGRLFNESDRWNSPKVVLVNQAFVDRYLSGERNPLGHRLRFSFYNGFAAKPYTPHEIVGVIGNTLNRDLAVETEPQILIGSDQMAFEGFQYFIRSSLPAATLRPQVQEAIWRVDPELERVGLTPLVNRVEQSLLSRRLIVWLLTVFGGIAIVVVVFGLASSLSATFHEMTRDLGIRSALGAPASRLAFESVRWAAFALLLSCLLTLPVSMALGRWIVLDRAPVGWDAASWIGSALVLGAIVSVCAYLPARRAAAVDAAMTLRAD
jgi:putative ABC transport system permease protein